MNTISNLNIKIMYHDKDYPHLEKIDKGDWIDLRTAEEVNMKAGEFKLINLGVSMKLPEGCEAHLAPRSSTFKKYGIIQTNSVGVVDSSFAGSDDCWLFPAYALRDTHIDKFDRICQFRLMKVQEPVTFEAVDKLEDENRGGFGSTGSK